MMESEMTSILPIALFVVAIMALNLIQFGRID